jgi:hypothetical protein
MSDRAEPESPNVTADSPAATLPADLKVNSDPEIARPMLDVHAPHEPIHTWKGFVIHIATITIGLLIAIGLEQAVEAIHHAHQRSELIADFNGECRTNLKVLSDNVANSTTQRSWYLAYISRLQAAQPSAGEITVAPPPDASFPRTQMPSRAVWKVAQGNGKAALLPENLAEIFARVDANGENLQRTYERMVSAYTDSQAVLDRFHVEQYSPAAVHLTTAQRDELVIMFAKQAAASDEVVHFSKNMIGVCSAVLAGVQSRAEMTRYLDLDHQATE